jgi:hypothetical protein
MVCPQNRSDPRPLHCFNSLYSINEIFNVIIGVPIFYFLSIHHKEKRFSYTSSPRKTFEENLEFYPVTRRAWNRAVAIRNAEIAQGAATTKAE